MVQNHITLIKRKFRKIYKILNNNHFHDRIFFIYYRILHSVFISICLSMFRKYVNSGPPGKKTIVHHVAISITYSFQTITFTLLVYSFLGCFTLDTLQSILKVFFINQKSSLELDLNILLKLFLKSPNPKMFCTLAYHSALPPNLCVPLSAD